MPKIPLDYVNYKTTSLFNLENVPKMFLFHHNTKKGVYGEINVKSGQLKFTGFESRHSEVEKEIILEAGSQAVSPPQYWHKVEFLTEDTEFFVKFYAQKDSDIVTENQSERNQDFN